MHNKPQNDSLNISVLKSWHLKIVILTAIVMPTITATGAYFGVREKITAEKIEISDRVSKLELDSTKNFADKTSLQKLDDRTQRMQNDITEIKTILRNKLR